MIIEAKAQYDKKAAFLNSLTYPECDVFETIDSADKEALREAFMNLFLLSSDSEELGQDVVDYIDQYSLPLAQEGSFYAVSICKVILMSEQEYAQLNGESDDMQHENYDSEIDSWGDENWETNEGNWNETDFQDFAQQSGLYG